VTTATYLTTLHQKQVIYRQLSRKDDDFR